MERKNSVAALEKAAKLCADKAVLEDRSVSQERIRRSLERELELYKTSMTISRIDAMQDLVDSIVNTLDHPHDHGYMEIEGIVRKWQKEQLGSSRCWATRSRRVRASSLGSGMEVSRPA